MPNSHPLYLSSPTWGERKRKLKNICEFHRTEGWGLTERLWPNHWTADASHLLDGHHITTGWFTAVLFTQCIISLCTCARSCWLFATPWTVAHQAPLSAKFSRQEHWSGLPFPPPGDLPNPGTDTLKLKSKENKDWKKLEEHIPGLWD